MLCGTLLAYSMDGMGNNLIAVISTSTGGPVYEPLTSSNKLNVMYCTSSSSKHLA